MTKVVQTCAEELKLEALETLFQALLKQGDKVRLFSLQSWAGEITTKKFASSLTVFRALWLLVDRL